jgi:hypothetical protein
MTRRARRILAEVLSRREEGAAETLAAARAGHADAEKEARRTRSAAVDFAAARLEALRNQAGVAWHVREPAAVRTGEAASHRKAMAEQAAERAEQARARSDESAVTLARAIALSRAASRAGLTGGGRRRKRPG